MTPSFPAVPRRGFLKKGLAGGALLLIGSGTWVALRGTRRGLPPRAALLALSPDEHSVFAAVAARVVPGDDAPDWPSAASLDCAGRADALLGAAHPEVARDFKRLLRLFESGAGGLLVGARPAPFTHLAPAAQDARLEGWRQSRIALLRSGYLALTKLAQALYYASPELYPKLGYPGPPIVPQDGQPQ